MAWVHYEPNPVRTGAIDCAVRAISKALDVSWERAYVMLSVNGFVMGNAPVGDEVWGSVLRQHGFSRHTIPNTCPECYTVEEFAEDHPSGTYVVKSENHVATIQDGNLYDSWDSSQKTAIYYWTDRKEG
mgnify:CR=1 FL=1